MRVTHKSAFNKGETKERATFYLHCKVWVRPSPISGRSCSREWERPPWKPAQRPQRRTSCLPGAPAAPALGAHTTGRRTPFLQPRIGNHPRPLSRGQDARAQVDVCSRAPRSPGDGPAAGRRPVSPCGETARAACICPHRAPRGWKRPRTPGARAAAACGEVAVQPGNAGMLGLWDAGISKRD